jgi:hypothetical protein
MTSTISSQIESSFKALLDQHTVALVEALSAKYEFDAAEAMQHLGEAKIPKGKAVAKAAKPAKQAKKEADGTDKPKRGANAFILWSQDQRSTVKDSNPDMGGREVTKELGRIWKEEVSEEIKAEWKEKATGSASSSDAE